MDVTYLHLYDFLNDCDLFKIKGVSNDAISLKLIPFSLSVRVRDWLHFMCA